MQKNVDHIREVRQAAGHVYGLLVDLSSLFVRRQRIAFSKAHNLNAVSSNQNMWADYIASKIPLTIEAQKLHALFRPAGMRGSIFPDADGSVAPSVAASYTPSVMALGRLRDSLSQSRLEMQNEALYLDESDQNESDQNETLYLDESEKNESLYLGESDRLFSTSKTQYLDESVEDRYIQSESPQVGESRTSPKHLAVTEEVLESALEGREDPFLSKSTLAHESGASMLESFNYAVSSRGGSCFSVSQTGSLFDSERSSSPPPNTGGTKTAIT